MFNNTVNLNRPQVGDVLALSLTSTAAGKSVRRLTVSATEYYEFSIASQLSTENAPLQTQRVVIRVDSYLYDTVLLKWVKSYAYLVVGLPSGAAYDVDYVTDQAFALIQFLFVPAFSGSVVTTVTTPTAANLRSTLIRLLSGEG